MAHLSKAQLIKALDYYFEKTNPKANSLTVYGENDLLLILEKSESSDEDYLVNKRPLNEDFIKENNGQLILIYRAIDKANQKRMNRTQKYLSYAAALIIGALVATFLGLALLGGGLGLAVMAAGTAGLFVGKLAIMLVAGTVAVFFTNKFCKPREEAVVLSSDVNNRTDQEKTYTYKKPSMTWTQRLVLPFTLANAGLKWFARQLILDNFLSKYIVGTIIAKVANAGNPHYKIQPQTIAKTLGPLIFQAGLVEPQLSKEGRIDLGPTLTTQWRKLDEYKYEFTVNDDSASYTNDEDKTITFENFEVSLKKGVPLSGVMASNDLVDRADRHHLHIIYFNGNSGTYHEETSRVAGDLLEYEALGNAVTAVQFNYPGVVNSSGHVTKADDLIQAGIAQVERLRELGVPYNQIALYGHSLGGSTSSHVAGYYLSRGIHLAGTYAACTFSSTTNVGLSYVKKVPVVGGLLGVLLRPILVFGLWGSEWQLNTAKHFARLPEEERDYSIVRSPKEIRRAQNPKDDPVLVHSASLHNSWRLRVERFCHKRGLFGYKKESYDEMRQGRKLSVFRRDEAGNLTLDPETCGHSEVPYCTHRKVGLRLSHRGKKTDYTTSDEALGKGAEAGVKMRGFFAVSKDKRSVANASASAPVLRALTRAVGTIGL